MHDISKHYRPDTSSTPSTTYPGVVTAHSGDVTTPPTLWDASQRNDLLLPDTVITHPADMHVHARIRLQGYRTDNGTSVIQHGTTPPSQGCFCSTRPCKRIGFYIIADSAHTIHAVMNDPIGVPYFIPIGIHPGTTIIAWCSRTIFCQNGLGQTPPTLMNVMAPSPQDTLIQTHSHSDDNQYRQTGGGVVQPIPLGVIPEGDELPDIPSVMTVTKSVPPPLVPQQTGDGHAGGGGGGAGRAKGALPAPPCAPLDCQNGHPRT